MAKLARAAMTQVGVDIIETDRIGRAMARWGEHFLRRVYTEEELSYCHSRLPELAARFAAKEAAMKALGSGRQGVGWREVEVVVSPGGQPRLRLHGRALRLALALGLGELALSLSHGRQWGLAVVVGGLER